MEPSPTKPQPLIDERTSNRIADNINEDYLLKAEAIQLAIKGYREMKQEIFLPDQLLQILDMKSGGQVDRDVFLQLFLKVKKTERSEFLLKDWVQVFLEAEEILNSKINTENINPLTTGQPL